jgi:hypothetical protein
VIARRLAVVPKRNYLSHFSKAQTDGLTRPDESKAIEHLGAVVTIAGGGAWRGGQQADALVVAQRLARHPGLAGQLTDPHDIDHTP